MYTLYYSPGACSMAIHVALLECGQEFKLEKINIQKGEGQSPEFLKLNPRGQVPVLIDGDLVLREGAAILIHLLDKHKSPLLPQSGKARTEALEWLMFCNATLHPGYGRSFFLKKNAKEPAKTELLDISVRMLSNLWKEVEARVSTHKYIAGDNITIADILTTVIANWAPAFPSPPVIGPNTKKLLQTIIARPAYKKALEVEQVEYKAAA